LCFVFEIEYLLCIINDERCWLLLLLVVVGVQERLMTEPAQKVPQKIKNI
jgi:hypothetical protein